MNFQVNNLKQCFKYYNAITFSEPRTTSPTLLFKGCSIPSTLSLSHFVKTSFTYLTPGAPQVQLRHSLSHDFERRRQIGLSCVPELWFSDGKLGLNPRLERAPTQRYFPCPPQPVLCQSLQRRGRPVHSLQSFPGISLLPIPTIVDNSLVY